MAKKNYKVTNPDLVLDTITETDSELSLFDQENPDITLFNYVDD